MEDAQFDRFARTLSGLNTRRGTLAGLLGGLALPLLLEAATTARNRRGKAVQAEKRRKKKCQSGLLTCKIKKGKKKKRFCVDAQSDPLNCGGCGNLCAAGQACQGGSCTCNGTLCPGCCDGKTCQAGSSHQQCGTNGAVCQACTGGRTCQGGACICPAGQTFCNGACVDTKTNAANCGSCGNACGGGNECNAPVCNQGTCGTKSTPDVSCNGGLGTCNASGQCIATVCAGKATSSPCFPFDAGTCNNGGSTCRCGSDINGNVACYENAYCNGGAQQCTSNADCVAMGFAVGSICFTAKDICCTSQTGCTTPCPT